MPAEPQPAAPAPQVAVPPAARGDLAGRVAISLLLIPFAFVFIYAGGWVLLLAVAVVLGLAAFEFARLFAQAGRRPATPLLVAGVVALAAAELWPALHARGLLVAGLTVAALAWHLRDYEAGGAGSGTDLAITLAGLAYVGGLGRYLVAVRELPDGLWWLLAALTSTWLADSGAYLVGKRLGRHRLTPRLSPKKTWEGYAGSIVFGAVGGELLSVGWAWLAGPASTFTWQAGAVVGLLAGALGTLGDLGISMFKREVGLKDTGHLLGGHGGVLDRIDSWLVSVPVAYYAALVLAVTP
jgi:phosphatidate cytidylyltransferase